MAPDGARGVFVAWADSRGNNYNFDIFVQHVLASGVVDPAWPPDGLAVCTAQQDQRNPSVISDATGGVIITWGDLRGDYSPSDVYAQHVLPIGTVDPAWPVNGLPVCIAPGDQGAPTIATDQAGGAIITWMDSRNVPGISFKYDIYAQHVLATGAVDPTWPAGGAAVCTVPDHQLGPLIVSDTQKGAVIVWTDQRSDSYYRTSYDIYAQRILASGAIDSNWPLDGLPVCTANDFQKYPSVAADGRGGALVAWEDGRTNYLAPTVYAHHVLVSGAVDPAWPTNGLALCPGQEAHGPVIAADDLGNAFVAWTDGSVSGGILGSSDVYAQRVLASGVVHPDWPFRGLALSTASRNQEAAAIVPDGAGGATVAWADNRNGNYYNSSYDIYAQHALGSGVVDPAWPVDGIAVSTAAGDQGMPVMLANGIGDAILSWSDHRPEPRVSGTNWDIYAHRVSWSSAPTPTMLRMMTAEASATGIRLRWQFENPAEFQGATLQRSDAVGGEFGPITAQVREEFGVMTAVDSDVVGGRTYWYRILARTSGGMPVIFGPISARAAVRPTEIALTQVSPNPASGEIRFEFELPRAMPARVDVVDILGREVAVLASDSYPPGVHGGTWDGHTSGGSVQGGVFFIRLHAGGTLLSRRIAVMR